MSIFASRVQKTLELPFDPPHTVTIQKLSGRHLERAMQENQIAAAEFLRRMGGAAFQQELTATVVSDEDMARARSNPFMRYDRGIILQRGIKAWSYPDPITAATVEDLSEEAADFLAREILALTLSAQEAAAQKEAPAPALSA